MNIIINDKKSFLPGFFGLLLILVAGGCSEKINNVQHDKNFIVGGDFSIIKKLEDLGGKYRINGTEKEGLRIFSENGYNYARLRIFHTPNMEGPVCNDLDYTIALAKQAKDLELKILLDFHYSDTWADPGHQIKPKAWDSISFDLLKDSVYEYTRKVLTAMDAAGVLPEMIQIGNEITPGMIWPDGKVYKDSGEDWESLCELLKAGIRAAKDVYGSREVQLMIHTDTGGNKDKTVYFFDNIFQRNVEFDVIGLSYYPWWHGTLDDLKNNIAFISGKYTKDIILVETAYYSNGYYPEPGEWVLDYQPCPPTEDGQYDFLVTLFSTLQAYPKVKGVFYWEPEAILVEGSGIHYLGRSLFDEQGNAFKGISAWK